MINIFKFILQKSNKLFHAFWGSERCYYTQHDFSLNSGERQAANTLEGIRKDHKVRYDFTIDYLKQQQLCDNKVLGLDLFCGTGYGTYMIASELSYPMLGIDGSEEAISFANSYYSKPNIFYSYKMFPFNLPNNIFNFIICYESIEHVQNAKFLLVQLALSLKNNGYLFLSTPNENSLPFHKNFHKFHYKHYTMEELMSMVKESGAFELKTWLGQNLYSLKDGIMQNNLPDHEMNLQEKQEGQLLIYVFKKVMSER